jgi:hypothetical protein
MENQTRINLGQIEQTTDIQTEPQATPQGFRPTLTGMSFYSMRKAEEINTAIAELPRATEKAIHTDSTAIERFKAIEVTDHKGRSEIVQIPHKSYQVIQHDRAFRPIIEGLTQAGIHNYMFVMKSTHKRAEMQIYATGTGYDTVSLGFSVLNSFDGSKALSYGFRVFGEQKTIELVGYRQVCSNGMKIRVPLENAEIVRPEPSFRLDEQIRKDTAH